ncbi:TolC family protein [bacterium]|nr:TolC family protein [bacterium]
MKSKSHISLYYLIIICLLLPFPAWAQQILTLDECINLALKNNSQYLNAQSRQEAAEAQVLSAYSQILPKLSLGFGGNQQHLGSLTRYYNTAVYKYGDDGKQLFDEANKPIVERYVRTLNETEPQIRNNFSGNVSFSQLVYDGGKWWNQIRTQNSYKNARDYDTETARLNTITNVKRYYYELLKAQNQLVVLEESVKLSLEQLNNSKVRFDIGSAARIDVLRSQVNYNQQNIQFITQLNEVDIARANLTTIMGRDISSHLIITEDSTISSLPISLQKAFKYAERNNPNIKMFHEEINRAYYSYKSAKAGRLPTISASFNYARFNPDLQLVYRDFDRNYSWTYGLNFSLPIFDGLKTRSDIRNERSNLKIAEENLTDTKRTLIKSIEQYYKYIENNLKKIVMLKENLSVAKENVRLATELYNVGSGTILETIDAQVNFTRSRIELVRAIYDAKIAQAQLEGLLGIDQLSALK